MTTEQRLISMGFARNSNSVWVRGETELSEHFIIQLSPEYLDAILDATERRGRKRDEYDSVIH